MSTEEIILELKKSPLFNVSLSSKELFHSNFLAWLSERFSMKFGKILNDYLEEFDDKDHEIIGVQRETRKIDLTLSFRSYDIIIENKVKSVPDKNQLINYQKKSSPNSKFILLTLIEPNFDPKEIGWKLMTYRTLSTLLKKLKIQLEKESYEYLILSDYIEFIDKLSMLCVPLKINLQEDKFDIYNSDFQLFKDARIHDIYLKHRYYQLSKAIFNSLKSSFPDENVINSKRFTEEKNSSKILVDFNIVNGKGVININHSITDRLVFGIMIDGIKYDHFIWGDNQNKKMKIAHNLRNNRKWFDFDFVEEKETYPKKDKAFNKYGNMSYRYAKISNKTDLKTLLERINKDVRRMIEISTNANIGYRK